MAYLIIRFNNNVITTSQILQVVGQWNPTSSLHFPMEHSCPLIPEPLMSKV